MPVTFDFAREKAADIPEHVAALCDELEAADAAGFYAALTVERPWS